MSLTVGHSASWPDPVSSGHDVVTFARPPATLRSSVAADPAPWVSRTSLVGSVEPTGKSDAAFGHSRRITAEPAATVSVRTAYTTRWLVGLTRTRRTAAGVPPGQSSICAAGLGLPDESTLVTAHFALETSRTRAEFKMANAAVSALVTRAFAWLAIVVPMSTMTLTEMRPKMSVAIITSSSVAPPCPLLRRAGAPRRAPAGVGELLGAFIIRG